MSFFDQLKGNFSKVTKDLSNKAQELTDTAKLNSKISDAKSLVKSTYAAIGEAYFHKYKEEAENEFADQFKIITEALASIDEYKAEINKIKGVTICESCGSEVTRESAFCPKCGAKVVRPVEEEAAEEEDDSDDAEKKSCSVCNAELEEDAQFCVNCGAAVETE